MLEFFLQFFYPNICPECKILIDKDEIFCVNCIEKIKPIVSHIIKINKKYNLVVFAVSAYTSPLKNLILKKSLGLSWASIKLAQMILRNINLSNIEIDYITAVPLHWTRYAYRGFNQAEVMAKYIAKELDKPYLNFLNRVKMTKYQFSLPVARRRENLKNAFVVDDKLSKFIKDKNILIVDDLYTTGSTLRYSSQAIIKFKPKSIFAVVACRVI